MGRGALAVGMVALWAACSDAPQHGGASVGLASDAGPDGGSTVDAGPPPVFPSSVCGNLCANLYRQCDPEYYQRSCVEDCELARSRSVPESFTSFASCCTTATLPADKCTSEGVGEVGFTDCDDEDVCGETLTVLPATCARSCEWLDAQCADASVKADCEQACAAQQATQDAESFRRTLDCCETTTLSSETCDAAGADGVGFDACLARETCGNTVFDPSKSATCSDVCANLAAQCSGEFFDSNCQSDCEDAQATHTKESFDALLACCAQATFPVGKCSAEGVGEVGFSDCDDSDMCFQAEPL